MHPLDALVDFSGGEGRGVVEGEGRENDKEDKGNGRDNNERK